MKKADRSVIERRIVFLILVLAVMLPMLFPLGLKTQSTPLTQKVYDLIESIPAGAPVILSFDYDPSVITEIQPMAMALIEHAWKKDHKVIATALWPQGPQMADMAFNDLKEKLLEQNPEAELPEYGQDYVNLGYKPGGLVTIQGMGRDMKAIFPSDITGEKYEEIPLLQKVRTLKDIRYVISLSAGDPGLRDWIMTARGKFNVPVAGGTTAVSTPGFLPYVSDQNQLHGLLGGLKSAAEYELLMGYEGDASRGMNPQSVAHILILLLILFGNIRAARKRKTDKLALEKNNG